MIENRPWLTIFSHTMLILGIAVILFPLYVAFVAATLDKQAVYAAPPQGDSAPCVGTEKSSRTGSCVST